MTISYDPKAMLSKNFETYLNTSRKLADIWGKDESVDVEGFGEVNGQDSMRWMVANDYTREVGFSTVFQSLWKNYTAVKDMEKQLQSSMG